MTMQSIAIQVRGMTCQGCARAVQRAAASVPGVESAQVDLAAGRLVARAAGGTTAADVAAAVREAGYEAEESA